jgi:hypothetical protein
VTRLYCLMTCKSNLFPMYSQLPCIFSYVSRLVTIRYYSQIDLYFWLPRKARPGSGPDSVRKDRAPVAFSYRAGEGMYTSIVYAHLLALVFTSSHSLHRHAHFHSFQHQHKSIWPPTDTLMVTATPLAEYSRLECGHLFPRSSMTPRS